MITTVSAVNIKNKLQCFGNKALTSHRRATNIFMGMLATIPITLVSPADAMVVQVTPLNPRLGDTLSIEINLESSGSDGSGEQNQRPLSVAVGEKTYPAFEIKPNYYRAFIPTTPLEKAGTRKLRVSGDGQEQNLLVKVSDRNFPIQRINLPPGKAGLQATEFELKRVAALKALQTPQKYWQGLFLKPNAARMSTSYGVRRYYNGKFANDYYHRGVDYAGATGSPVIAPAPGRIALVGKVSQGFRVHGNVIGIDHGQGVIGIFMHLSRINVKEGDFVKAGQVIGAVGSTGASTGPHLHWGLYVNGLSIDPIPWQTKIVD
jgi:murein DD-endopeptidase MepM/ murein hydrolase activator NlpD